MALGFHHACLSHLPPFRGRLCTRLRPNGSLEMDRGLGDGMRLVDDCPPSQPLLDYHFFRRHIRGRILVFHDALWSGFLGFGLLIIATLLFAVEKSDFLYLQHETGMNKGTLSSHISRLEEAGYVEVSKTYRGKVPQTLLRLTETGRTAFEAYRRKLKKAL
jgi:DNA-binding transcriptional ArsR family regulator